MNSFESLVKIFESFPGIGPRQARRFAYFLLSKNTSFLDTFAGQIKNLKTDMAQCDECLRFFVKKSTSQKLCDICADHTRDESVLVVVAKDTDIAPIERSGAYAGKYFVLGGLVPILEKNPEEKVRLKKLDETVSRKILTGLKEIILALNATVEGENTAEIIKENISGLPEASNLKISELGRGMSTGSEIEYADSETIKASLQNKK